MQVMEAKKIKRDFHNMPLSGYYAKQWFEYSLNIHEKVYGTENETFLKSLTYSCNVLNGKIYPIVFNCFNWSAENFASFLESYIRECKKNGFKFGMNLICTSYGKRYSYQFNSDLLKKRETDIFEKYTYLKHRPLLKGYDNDLFNILNEYMTEGCSGLKLMYNYGIPIYHKFIQIKENLSFKEAKEKVKTVLKNEICMPLKNNKEILSKILKGVARNSILWSPYCEISMLKKKIQGNIPENIIVLQWQEEFKKIWEVFKFNEELFWEVPEASKIRNIIPTVKDLFLIDIKNIPNK
jgi:hypothetical protein